MKRAVKRPIDAEVIALWRGRMAALQMKLIETPSADGTWFWQIQCEIIRYLLNRYAGIEAETSVNASDKIVHELPAAPGPIGTQLRPSGSFAKSAVDGKPPRASEQIRPALQKIVEVNQSRYEQLERQRLEEMAARLEQDRSLLERLLADDELPFAEIAPPSPGGRANDDDIEQMFYELLMLDAPEAEGNDLKPSS